MAAFMVIVLTIIFPMSNAYSKDDEAMYTTFTIDPQRNMVIRCTLLKLKGDNVIVCTEKPVKTKR